MSHRQTWSGKSLSWDLLLRGAFSVSGWLLKLTRTMAKRTMCSLPKFLIHLTPENVLPVSQGTDWCCCVSPSPAYHRRPNPKFPVWFRALHGFPLPPLMCSSLFIDYLSLLSGSSPSMHIQPSVTSMKVVYCPHHVVFAGVGFSACRAYLILSITVTSPSSCFVSSDPSQRS